MDPLFKIIGASGILLISFGILNKNALRANTSHLFGGICLETYSIYLGDFLFIILQAIFISVASYKIYTIKKGSK